MKERLLSLGTLAGLALLYFSLGKLGLSLAFLNASSSPVWPPTGLALAALLLLGYRMWPAVLVGAFFVNWTTPQTSHAPLACLAIAIGNTLEALLGAFLTNRFARGIAAFDRAGDMGRYVLLAAVPSTLISAGIGVSTLVLAHIESFDRALPVWLTWWTGNLISDLLVAPLLIIWLGKPMNSLRRRRVIEASILLLCAIVLSQVLFGLDYNIHSELYPLTPLGIPLLLWAGFRFHQRGAIGAAAVMAAFAVRGTYFKFGPFWVGGHPNDSLLLLQMFMGTVTLTAMFVAAIVAEREELLKRETAARDQAQRASQAKDHFMAVLSHELRTPLTPVLLAAGMLEESDSIPDSVRGDLKMIRRNVELEARLIDDLLDISRITHGKMTLNPQPVSVHSLLDAVRSIVGADAHAKQMLLRYHPQAVEDHVNADSVRLQQVFWNLFKNSIKFTPRGGQVAVRTWNEQTSDQTPELVVEFRDTGVGIKPDLLPTLFMPFDQGALDTTQRFGGLGLGLAISKAIVDLHGGRISAASDGEGRGAAFTIRMQTVGAPAQRSGDRPTPTTHTAQIPLRILLVEDDPDTLKALVRLLESNGFALCCATGVNSALALAKLQTFDILVSDIGLPDGNGYELVGELRSRGVNMPAIALTGFGMEDDLSSSRAAGFAAHLTKPIDAATLSEAIRELASCDQVASPTPLTAKAPGSSSERT